MTGETPDAILQRYMHVLGDEFGGYFFHLNQSVIGLVGIWDMYRYFYGTSDARVDLLNKASGYVARTIQDSLHERVILGVCQVSDPFRSRGQRNITVQGLPEFITDPSRHAEILPMIEAAKQVTSFARDLRNKIIAHSDLDTATGSYTVDYSSRERIVLAIKSIISPLRFIHTRYFDTTQLYHAIRPLPDEAGFLRCIYLGLDERQLSSGPPGKRFPEWLIEDDRNEFDSEFYLPTGGNPP